MSCVSPRCCILSGASSSFRRGAGKKKLGTSHQLRASLLSGRRGSGVAVTRAEATKKEVKICTKKECKRMGSLRTLAKFEALLESDKEKLLEGLDLSTVHCLSECGMGPNVQINGEDGPIINGVKTDEDVAKVVDRLLAD